MLKELQQKVTKLQASLDLQMHMQSDLEGELTEKNKEIDGKGTCNGQNIFTLMSCSVPGSLAYGQTNAILGGPGAVSRARRSYRSGKIKATIVSVRRADFARSVSSPRPTNCRKVKGK